MPRLEKKRLLVLTTDELRQIVKACNVRDKAIMLFMANSELRRSEVISFNWQDIDMQSGLACYCLGITPTKGNGGRDAMGEDVNTVMLDARRQIRATK